MSFATCWVRVSVPKVCGMRETSPQEVNLVILVCAFVFTENCHNPLTSPVRNKQRSGEHCCPICRGLEQAGVGGGTGSMLKMWSCPMEGSFSRLSPAGLGVVETLPTKERWKYFYSCFYLHLPGLFRYCKDECSNTRKLLSYYGVASYMR